MNLEWHTEQRVVEDLVPYSKNPRKITKEDQEKLKDSLEKFNLAEIPGIDIDGILVWGHQRVKILILLNRGKEVIDVRVPNRKLSDDEFRELNIRSNIQAGSWDFDMLIKDFSEVVLKGWGMGIQMLSHSQKMKLLKRQWQCPH